MNLKPFNLELALQGAQVVSRCGEKVRIIDTARKGERSLVALHERAYRDDEVCFSHFPNGAWKEGEESDNDLFLVAKKVTYWYCVYRTALGDLLSADPGIYELREAFEKQTPLATILKEHSIEVEVDY